MEKMEVDDVVDLSMIRDAVSLSNATVRDLRALTQNAGLTITPAPPSAVNNEPYGRRVLRPRTEPKSYAEAPNIVLLPTKLNGRQQNGNIDSDTDDEEMPPIIAIKELSAAEIWERDRGLRKLREELRNEETKLVLLKKLKQSQQVMKENLIVTHTNASNSSNPLVEIPAALSLTSKGSLSVTPAPPPLSSNLQITAHSKSSRNSSVNPLLRQPSGSGRSSVNVIPPTRSSLPGGATLTPGGPPSHRYGHSRTGSNLTITPSVTITPTSVPPRKDAMSMNLLESAAKLNQVSSSVSITPAPPHINKNDQLSNNDRLSAREEAQTPAQRQAAAKIALRKQLEKTLLQIPPPKPPPPEMNFIPNPSNTEFVYLLGLETVVDYLTEEKSTRAPMQQPPRCSQCNTDFTPLWKREKQGKAVNATFQNTSVVKDSRIICEQCDTSNTKKELKAEHTNRLKNAFVRALQEEQEIDQGAQRSPSPTSHSSRSGYTQTPSVTATPVTITPHPAPAKSQTPTQRPTPPLPLPSKSATPPTTSRSRSQQQSSSSSSQQSSMQSSQQQKQQAQQQQQQQQQHAQLQQQNEAAAQLNAAAQLASLGIGNLGALAGLGGLGNLGNLASLGGLGNLANVGNMNNAQAAQAAQAQAQAQAQLQAQLFLLTLQQQMLRGLQGMGGNAAANAAANAQLMQLSPLYLNYQLQMAHQALGKKSSSSKNNMPNMNEVHRLAEMQRQYQQMLELTQHQQQASGSSSRQNNWKP